MGSGIKMSRDSIKMSVILLHFERASAVPGNMMCIRLNIVEYQAMSELDRRENGVTNQHNAANMRVKLYVHERTHTGERLIPVTLCAKTADDVVNMQMKLP